MSTPLTNGELITIGTVVVGTITPFATIWWQQRLSRPPKPQKIEQERMSAFGRGVWALKRSWIFLAGMVFWPLVVGHAMGADVQFDKLFVLNLVGSGINFVLNFIFAMVFILIATIRPSWINKSPFDPGTSFPPLNK